MTAPIRSASRYARSRAAPSELPSSRGRTSSASRATVGFAAIVVGTNGVSGTASAKRIPDFTCQ